MNFIYLQYDTINLILHYGAAVSKESKIVDYDFHQTKYIDPYKISKLNHQYRKHPQILTPKISFDYKCGSGVNKIVLKLHKVANGLDPDLICPPPPPPPPPPRRGLILEPILFTQTIPPKALITTIELP